MLTHLKHLFWSIIVNKMPERYVIDKFSELKPTQVIAELYRKHVRETFVVRRDRIPIRKGRKYYNLYFQNNGYSTNAVLSKPQRKHRYHPINTPVSDKTMPIN